MQNREVLRQATVDLLAMGIASAAANLTDAEKNEALAQLERTRAGVVAATKGLSEAQWKFKPAPDRWSVAETLEHIALTEDLLFQNTTQKVMQAPAGKPDRDVKAIDRMVLNMIADRSHKAQAPDVLVPTSKGTPTELLDRFLKSRARTVEFLKATQGLRDHAVDSPIGQQLDGYEWVLYMSAHSERHTKQILEVKADPIFPKR
jgi:hypothetical protein